jgi:hypothetical protein
MLAWLASGLLALSVAACSNAERVALGACGNHVLEAGEDCDGAPGCGSDCHYPCGTGASCPGGFGCDVTAGICRTPNGVFSQSPLLPNSLTVPVVADFDADGRDDLLLVGANQFEPLPSTVYYFGAGALTSSVQLPAGGPAAAADVTADGRADIVLGGSSLFAYRSLAARRFSPILGTPATVSDGTQLYSADLDGDGAREILVAQDSALFRASSSGTLTRLCGLGLKASALNSVSAAGTLQPGMPRSSDALALFEPATSRIHVYGVKQVGQPNLGLLSVVQLSVPAPVVGLDAETVQRLLLVDINTDGRADLMAITDLDHVYVAYGVGDGSFNSDRDLPTLGSGDGQAKPFYVPGEGGIATAWQSDNDAPINYFPAIPRVGASSFQVYAQALAVDLTGDGRTDVAAVAVGAGQGMDLFRATPSGVFSRLAVATNATPTLRDIGDFDGDGAPDLLLTEGLSTDAEQTTASVLFSPVTPNSARVQEQIELKQIAATAAGYLSDDLGNSDGFADVAVLHQDPARALQLGILEGGADRLLHSELSKAQSSDPGSQFLHNSPVVGHLRAGQPSELAVISSAPFLAGQESVKASLELFSIDAGSSVSLGRRALDENLAGSQVLALDLDTDGVDEIYLLRDDDSLLQLQLSGGGSSALSAKQTANLVGSRLPFNIAAADVNSDGHPDLSLRGDKTIWVLMANTQQQSPVLHTLNVPDGHCFSMVAHAWLQTDSDPTRELVLLCEKDFSDTTSKVLSIFKADLVADTLSFVRSQPGPASAALAVGDFNGDGVEDLAASNGELALLLGNAR